MQVDTSLKPTFWRSHLMFPIMNHPQSLLLYLQSHGQKWYILHVLNWSRYLNVCLTGSLTKWEQLWVIVLPWWFLRKLVLGRSCFVNLRCFLMQFPRKWLTFLITVFYWFHDWTKNPEFPYQPREFETVSPRANGHLNHSCVLKDMESLESLSDTKRLELAYITTEISRASALIINFRPETGKEAEVAETHSA